jgi:hypothetical protein
MEPEDVYKSPPLVPILKLMKSVHNITPYFFNIRFNIILSTIEHF